MSCIAFTMPVCHRQKKLKNFNYINDKVLYHYKNNMNMTVQSF
mgnify:CR=1 FL=1